jgi:hypothetical protein
MVNINKKLIFILIIITTLISACSGNDNKNAVENYIHEWSKDQKIIEVKTIKWIGTEEAGTKTAPETKYGLDVTFKVIDNTYRENKYIEWLNVKVIEPDLAKGFEITKTINGKAYPKDGKIIVEANGFPYINSALFKEFIKDGISEKDIIIKGDRNTSTAFTKLKNYLDENLPSFEKLSFEVQSLAQLKETTDSSEKAKNVKKAYEEFENVKRRMSLQENSVSENRTNTIYAIQRNNEKIQKCIEICQRRLNSDSDLRRSAEREYGMNYKYLYCNAPVTLPSPGIKQCQNEVFAAQTTEINSVNERYKNTINDIKNIIQRSAEQYNNSLNELNEYRIEINSKYQQKSYELSSLERKLNEVNRVIESLR